MARSAGVGVGTKRTRGIDRASKSLLRSMSIAHKNKIGVKSQKPARRQRRQPEEVRVAALEAARRLLLTQGPDAITLKAVARDLGMTHTNLIHHFGSAAELQSALMREMV